MLLLELVFGAFLLLQKSHRSTVDPDAMTSGSTELAATSPPLGDAHVTAGTVVGPAPLSVNTVTDPKQSTSRTVVTVSGSPVNGAVQVPRANTRPRESVAVRGYVESKTDPVLRTEGTRDSLHRHGSNSVAVAITDELVKESAKLDPALPPPVQPSHDDSYRTGSNPVAAAMTNQLVRESAKLDPSLPPPNQSDMK
ncbi:hypothetical protein P0D72_01300 [Paraburkholderia sediminicola]|uniref:hypothetical protein n=1 Tax=Paraburkholderia sediminicola TaxID=458836 RepID=UPI0038BD01E0